jgi:large subunit ribosomal protein L17
MRHRARAHKLSRTSAHRIAMYRNLVTSLLDHERVETTDAKAKELRRIADRMITLGKRGDLHARRRAMRVIRVRNVAAKVFGELAERYRTRPGGYTRVLKTRRRTGDAAGMSIVELVEPLEVVKPETKAKKTASRKKEAAKAPAKKKVTAKAASKKAGAKKATSKKAASKKKTAKKATRKKATTSKASAKKSAKSKKPRAKAD